jgi:hypothetical protein
VGLKGEDAKVVAELQRFLREEKAERVAREQALSRGRRGRHPADVVRAD